MCLGRRQWTRLPALRWQRRKRLLSRERGMSGQTLQAILTSGVFLLLVRCGVKEGMHDPREMTAHAH